MQLNRLLLIGGIALVTTHATAQYRDGQSVTVAPPPPTPVEATPDPAIAFGRAYAAAGRPRIVLLWTRALSDQAATATVQRNVVRDTGRASENSSTQTTQGPTGSATITDSDRNFDRTLVETRGVMAIAETARKTGLSEREMAMIERSFTSELNRAGVRFVDRALAMRTTAAKEHRAGGDQQLIETDALVKLADMMMEVLLVEDRNATVGYAFDVRVKDIKACTGVAASYSPAIPVPGRAGPGGWRAGPNGYEFASPLAPPPPTAPDVGRALARDVMYERGPALGNAR